MADLRAYALAVAEVRGLSGCDPDDRARLRALARRTSPVAPPRVRDLLGPMHRRVPGAPVLRDDDPTPGDLETLLAGEPVTADRAAATWRLVERLVGGLAHGATRVPVADGPPGALFPLELALPAEPGTAVGWCTRARAETVEPLRPWLGGFDGPDGWTAAALRAGRPEPDVVVFCGTAWRVPGDGTVRGRP